MNNRLKDSEDLVLRDYKGTGFAKAMKIIALIVCAVYLVFLVYFLIISQAGLFPLEYALLICFAAAPVFLMIAADVLPFIEYNKFRKTLNNDEYRHFIDEYAANKEIAKTRDGIAVDNRIVFFFGKIAVPQMTDIVWIYKVPMGRTGKDNIIFLSRHKKFYITVVTSSDSDSVLDRYVYFIRQYSPDLMVGDNEENDKRYTELFEHKKYKSRKK